MAKRKIKKPLKPKTTKKTEAAYYALIREKIINPIIEAVQAQIKPNIESYIYQASLQAPQKADRLEDSFYNDFNVVLDVFGKKVGDESTEPVAATGAEATQAFNKEQFSKQMKHATGVNPFLFEPYLKDQMDNFTYQNMTLIKNMGDDYIKKVETSVLNGIKEGRLGRDIQKTVAKSLLGLSDSEKGIRNRAKLIARDQVSKFNGQLNELRQKSVGITKYVWSTSGDDRVRDSHEAKDGVTFSWDDPPTDTGNPGEDFQCRCVALPIFDELL